MARALRHPFARALFMLFMTSEVHPFEDGNGRISRLMMNAELVSARQAKILVPTVFRQDYIGALRRLSRNGDSNVLLVAMNRLRDFSRRLVCDSFDSTRRQLEESNAFSDDNSTILRF
jgi:Fic family protein